MVVRERWWRAKAGFEWSMSHQDSQVVSCKEMSVSPGGSLLPTIRRGREFDEISRQVLGTPKDFARCLCIKLSGLFVAWVCQILGWGFQNVFKNLAEIHRVVVNAGTSTSRRWMFLNKTVDYKCLPVVLGIGNERLKRTSTGRLDLRFRWSAEVT